jgi:hypothetical protein
MAGKDKHPPLDPNRWATNKRVKVGEKSHTGAKTKKAALTANQKKMQKHVDRSNINLDRSAALGKLVEKETKKGVISPKGGLAMHYKRKFPKGGMI